VRRLVLLSSSTVYGPPSRLHGTITESHPTCLRGEPCSDNHAEAESIFLEAHRLGLLEVVILRPATCYGPGDPHFLPRLFSDLRAGRSALLGDGRANALLTHVDHVAEMAVLAALHPDAPGHAFHVADREPVTWRDAIARLAPIVGATARVRRVPVAVAWLAACASEAAAGALGRPPALTRHMVELLTARHTLSTEAARAVLGWTPRRDTATGLEACARLWASPEGNP
jgi:nucleoside-diphosphate-sugar epimerase